ncbi:c6 zinc finger domain protein [Moniliophthora roreri MCA 2997]|uniref:C6 zinc finger domain protein n=1 Tax=Moniliophthora roreri (strain MCA 2997) TaxID=1381753 RepID=V2YZA9_MONRO|nr:c6 zinc finger domain protein [Moniliophthora roreri MCA 2997]
MAETNASGSNVENIVRHIRPHSKSRGGCLQCKKRKVKCDEVQPQCGNCTRRKMECTWQSETKRVASSKQRKTSELTTQQSSELPLILSPSSSSSSTFRNSPLPPSPSSSMPNSLDMTSLKLLHHFSLVTAPTLAYGTSSSIHVAQFVVPRLAFNNPFLMHLLLAASSIHLHTLYHPLGISDEKYLDLAQSHRQRALTLMPADLDPDFGMISLAFLVICKFADSLSEPPARLSPNDSGFPLILSVIELIRRTVHSADWDFHDEELQAMNWPLRPRANAAYLNNHPVTNGIPIAFPFFLTRIHLPTTEYPNPEEVMDPETSRAYEVAADALCDCWHVCQRPNTELGGMLSWPVRISDMFYRFLIEKRPRALVLLYYYCMVLTRLGHCWWAVGGVEIARNSLGWIGLVLGPRWTECVISPISRELEFSTYR